MGSTRCPGIFQSFGGFTAAMGVSTRSDSLSNLKKNMAAFGRSGLNTCFVYHPNQTFGPKFHLNPSIYPKKSKQTPSNTIVFWLFFETHRHLKQLRPKRVAKATRSSAESFG